jgi:hypothetical protein
VDLVASSTAMTGTGAQTPVGWKAGQGTAQGVTVNQTGVENFGTPTYYESHAVPVTSGLYVIYAPDERPVIPPSTLSFRLRVVNNLTGNVACTGYATVVFEV